MQVKGIQSVETGGAIFEIVVEAPEPLRLKEVAALSGLTPSKARMYLVSLLRTGLIDQDGDGRYRSGRKAARLGLVALGQDRLMAAARRALDEVAQRTGHPVFLSVWDRGGSMIVAGNDAREPLPVSFKVGRLTPLDTATGHVFLAYLPAEATEDAARRELETDVLANLPKLVSAIRACGVATAPNLRLTAELVVSGYGAIAVPIFDSKGTLELVMTALHYSNLDPKNHKEEVDLLRSTALAISA